ncbi:MAG TPA: hypothetical protein DDZ41_11555, partial [Flavobacterium sp.]|nr:hypothetical protein [Flavobacterium sp.]
MNSKNIIYKKLEKFISKYYINQLIKGIILFIGIGLLYFIFTIVLEFFLWLPVVGRTILFWSFIIVECFLLLRFILFPIFSLFNLKEGIDFNQASIIIGQHFSEVSDKLTNFLQLSNQNSQSELLIASIEQKANSLSPIPFSSAINFKKNKKYLPFLLVPTIVFFLFFITDNVAVLSQGFKRVVNYDVKFMPPPPFQFQVLNPTLSTQQNKDFILQVKTVGSIIPEIAVINIGDQEYVLENISPGLFQYRFVNVVSPVTFSFSANAVHSPIYNLKVINVPEIVNFQMNLTYPKHLNRKPEVIKGTGNAFVPEGTLVKWNINTNSTIKVLLKTASASLPFFNSNNVFNLSAVIKSNLDYQVITSNQFISNFENLRYQIIVIKDQYPTISVAKIPDSIKSPKDYLIGQLSDDHGFSKLQV